MTPRGEIEATALKRRLGNLEFAHVLTSPRRNWLAVNDAPDGEAIGVLPGALEDEDREVAETTAWALGRSKGVSTGAGSSPDSSGASCT